MVSVDTPRAFAWSEEEVKALISIWGESNIQEELDGDYKTLSHFNLCFDHCALHPGFGSGFMHYVSTKCHNANLGCPIIIFNSSITLDLACK